MHPDSEMLAWQTTLSLSRRLAATGRPVIIRSGVDLLMDCVYVVRRTSARLLSADVEPRMPPCDFEPLPFEVGWLLLRDVDYLDICSRVCL